MIGFIVKSDFFCLFKTGDNINYNLEILRYLYSLYYKADDETRNILIKPIVIWLTSITEAVLHDFHIRICSNTKEGVINLSKNIVDYIKNKKIDEFGKYIASSKKHDFFNLKDTNFYKKLEELRKTRNRIHIQNSKFFKPRDESTVFTEEIKILAEKCTEKVVKTMSKKYARPNYLSDYVADMYFPWKEYFPEN